MGTASEATLRVGKSSESFFEDIPKMWSEQQVQEFTKADLNVNDIVRAYKAVMNLPQSEIKTFSPLKNQDLVTDMVKRCVNCPKTRVQKVPEYHQVILLVYDTDKEAQNLVA